MLIVHDAHLCPGWADRAWRSGVTTARSRLSAYPLVMSDDARADRVPCHLRAPASPQTSWSIWRPSSILQLCINHCMFSRLPTPLLP